MNSSAFILLILLCAGCAVARVLMALRATPSAAAEAVKQPDINPAHATIFLQSRQSAAQPEIAITPSLPSVIPLPGYLNLVWTESDPTDVAGYNIYYGGASRSYTNLFSAGDQTETTVSNLSVGETYYFAVTAVSYEGIESDFSDEAVIQVPQVLELHFDTPGTALESSTDLMNWQSRSGRRVGDAWRVVMDPTLSMEFYRTETQQP